MAILGQAFYPPNPNALHRPPIYTCRSPWSLSLLHSPSSQMTPPPVTGPSMLALGPATSGHSSPATGDLFTSLMTLPPPPSRSRKIIQMKPRHQDHPGPGPSTKESLQPVKARGDLDSGMVSPGLLAAEGPRKKASNATNAVGRKIARKTAHSLIERRRRSKINEEFALLKNMIPACSGEMHKLAILQASIEYIRYLEECLVKLKAQPGLERKFKEESCQKLPPIREYRVSLHPEDSVASDAASMDPETTSTALPADLDAQAFSFASPGLGSQIQRHRQHSWSSVSTDQRRFSYSTSAGGPSPPLGPQLRGLQGQSNVLSLSSTPTSPALDPLGEVKQETTTGLLLLNHGQRQPGNSARGLSVRDLLSIEGAG